MDVLIERVAGIDIGKRTMAVTVRMPAGKRGRRSVTRSFKTVTAEVLALRDWLVEEQVSVVAMEATGDYWKPVYYLLEDTFEVWLCNPAHIKRCRAARPTSRTPNGSRSWSSTD